jgi:hypothetical protein
MMRVVNLLERRVPLGFRGEEDLVVAYVEETDAGYYQCVALSHGH